jgi:hypothetical protein
MRRVVVAFLLTGSAGCQSAAAPPASKELPMAATSFPWPARAARCKRGDRLAHLEAGRWKIYQVEDFVLLDRLVEIGADDEVHVLLTAFEPGLASADEALHAAEHGELDTRSERVIRKLADFRDSETRVLAPDRP